jgi:hypothetical protein
MQNKNYRKALGQDIIIQSKFKVPQELIICSKVDLKRLLLFK